MAFRTTIPLVAVLLASVAAAQVGSTQVGSANRNASGEFRFSSELRPSGRVGKTVTIDAKTRWAFRTISPATVSTPVIRLGDIVRPVDPNQSGWDRMQRAPIGLVPVDGRPMTIRRDRLSQVILAAEATPRAIDWLGDETIRVVYRPESSNPIAASQATGTATIRPVSAVSPVEQTQMTAESVDPLSVADIKRVTHWIDLSLKRFHPEIAETFAASVPTDQPAMHDLRRLTGVNSIEPIGPIQDGTCYFQVVARGVGGTFESDIAVQLTSHPKFVVSNRNLGRGQRINANDLELKPFPVESVQAGAIADPQAVIGQEVRTSLRAGQPISRSDFGSPILIHRGDLIEIRVIGGGISVTTNAKALGDGSEAELIEIETMSPRKRLVARVVRPGMVEIVTRAPQVR